MADFQKLDMRGGHVQSRILQANVVLEALGNARTLRNDNSSRFGKMIRLLFSKEGKLEGSFVETYLLELTRVIHQQEKERNFHIFYMMLTDPDASSKETRQLEAMHHYNYLLQTKYDGCFDRRDGVQDAELYTTFLEALRILALDKETIDSFLNVIMAVLKVGNFYCETTTSNEGDVIIERTTKNMHCLQHVSDLLEIDPEDLLSALSTRSVNAGGETFLVTLESDKILTSRNIFAKSLYNTIFNWMISYLNTTVSPAEFENVDDLSSIGLLDMFGFEDLAQNSLEQLLINYTNEHLQQQYDFMMIEEEQTMYSKEGIQWDFIKFPCAQDCLDLVYSRGTCIIGVLDDASRAPGGSDASFISDVYRHFGDHSRVVASNLDKGKSLFGIRHYAGLVKYASSNFVNKNKVVSFPLQQLLIDSTSTFANNLIQYAPSTNGNVFSPKSRRSSKWKNKWSSDNIEQQPEQVSNLNVDTVAEKFCQNVHELLEKLSWTTSHYVKCFKPNNDQTKENFVPQNVKLQMNYSGILHSLKVLRSGFPIRYTYKEFWKKFFPLILSFPKNHLVSSPDSKSKQIFNEVSVKRDMDFIKKATIEVVKRLRKMEKAGKLVVPAEFDAGCRGICIQTGRNLVFLRYSGYFTLQKLLASVLGKYATVIQSYQRGYAVRQRFSAMYKVALNIQRIRQEYMLRQKMRRRRLILTRFVKRVSTRIVSQRLSIMVYTAFRRWKVKQEWNAVVSAIRRFISICQLRRHCKKYSVGCELVVSIFSKLYAKILKAQLVEAFEILKGMGSPYNHYIRNKKGVEKAFKGVVVKLQRSWRWKSQLFYSLHTEAQLPSLPLSRELMLKYFKQKHSLMQLAPKCSPLNLGIDLLRANRHILWAMYANYVNMAVGSITSSSLRDIDCYNVQALPVKLFYILMKDWGLSPQLLNQAAVTNVVQQVTESKYRFLDFDKKAWGKRYPNNGSPRNGRKFTRYKQCLNGDELDVSFNMFCQVLLLMASALSTAAGQKRSYSQYFGLPATISSVTMMNAEDMRFEDSAEIGLYLRLLLTDMDQSDGRNKVNKVRGSLPVPPLLGVIGTEPMPEKKVVSPRKSSPVKRQSEIVIEPISAHALAVLKRNRPQLLLIALYYSHGSQSLQFHALSEKEKVFFVNLPFEEMWNMAVDYGICPNHCR